MRSKTILLCLLTIRCASPASSSAPVAAAPEEELQPASFAASQPTERKPLTLLDVELRTAPQASAPRYFGRLWTLCDIEHPEFGVCLSRGQVKEIFLRFGEDQGRAKRVAIDAIKERDTALAQAAAEAVAKRRAILGGVLGGVGALLVGVTAGILIDRFAVPLR
ncbi:MAG: hypothetical protein IT381_28160 [Deltaproteobacteria bacterium]|nr:hypothetical protein [Deltaproteobacteria bacterium]